MNPLVPRVSLFLMSTVATGRQGLMVPKRSILELPLIFPDIADASVAARQVRQLLRRSEPLCRSDGDGEPMYSLLLVRHFFGELGFALTTEDWKQVVDAARQRRRLNPTSATTVVDVDDLDAVMNIDSECTEELAMRDSAIVVAHSQQGNRFASMPLDMLAVVAQRQDECIRDLRRNLKIARRQNRRK